MLELREIHKSYDKKSVLKGLSFSFKKGKIYGILGRNGAGKTTLFQIISGENVPNSGEVLFEGHPIEVTEVGLVNATPRIPEFLTGYEFCRFLIEICGKPPLFDCPEEIFEFFRIDWDDEHRLMSEYSHGMKSKMNLMAMMIGRPKVILLDEPLTALDMVAAEQIKKVLMMMKRDTIIILATHIFDLAQTLCDEIILLKDGLMNAIDPAIWRSEQATETIVAMMTEENER